MKNKSMILSGFALAIVTAALLLSGCGAPQTEVNGGSTEIKLEQGETPEQNDDSKTDDSQKVADEQNVTNEQNAADDQNKIAGQTVYQPGPYGEIGLTIPDGWNYQLCELDSDEFGESTLGVYGIRFYPDDVEKGYISVTYTDYFGVCGTGLSEEPVELAGVPATIGIYDGHSWWDFIVFDGQYEKIVAQAFDVAEWQEQYMEEAKTILNTLTYDSQKKTGAVCVYNAESDNQALGLIFSLRKITPSGARISFTQYNSEVEKEIIFGQEYAIEKEVDGKYEELPVVVEGDYGFEDIAYIVEKGEETTQEVDWKWLYGELEPGNYRMVKTVNDQKIYAYFLIN